MSEKKIKLKGGKKIRNARQNVDSTKSYDLASGLKILKDSSFTKFDQTIDVAINLGVDTKHSDQIVRGITQLPHGTGRKVRVAVICRDEDKIREAKEVGADLCGSEEIINDIKAGKIDFDVCIATPDMMGVMGSVAKILGPKGLMPNPKLGTVATNVSQAVQNAKSGQVEFRADKSGIVHAGVGKMSFDSDKLESNILNFVSAIVKAKPTGVKGTYVKRVHISSTMGPSVRIDGASFNL